MTKQQLAQLANLLAQLAILAILAHLLAQFYNTDFGHNGSIHGRKIDKALTVDMHNVHYSRTALDLPESVIQ